MFAVHELFLLLVFAHHENMLNEQHNKNEQHFMPEVQLFQIYKKHPFFLSPLCKHKIKIEVICASLSQLFHVIV